MASIRSQITGVRFGSNPSTGASSYIGANAYFCPDITTPVKLLAVGSVEKTKRASYWLAPVCLMSLTKL